MKSVVLHNVSKVYSLGDRNGNFKELISGMTQAVFSGLHKKEQDSFYALRDISFELEEGDVLGIIGDNGAGKSTLLKIISGVSQPSTGEVTIEGRISSILEIGTGFHMELSGRENIFLNGSILGMERSEIEKQFSNILRFSGLKDFIDVPIKRYSSGMYLRLAFSVLAHLSTEVILLDEIIYVGDAEFRMKSYNKVRELAKSGKTVLIVSHDLTSISDLCTKCLLLEKGQIKAFGETGDIVRRYMDKSLKKYIDSAEEEQNEKNNELSKLQSRIEVMDKVIQEKEDALNSTSVKEQKLISELNGLKEEAKELFKIRKALESKAEYSLHSTAFVKSEKIWNEETTAPGNDNIRLRRIACLAENGNKTITQADDIRIEIEYWKYIEEPCTIALTASYNFNQLAFGTTSVLGSQTALHNEGKGFFKSACHINKYLLNHGMFAFSVFFLNNQGKEMFGLHNVVAMKIEYVSGIFKGLGEKGNVMLPFVPSFKWS